ncbi:thiolase [Sphingomonas panacis]|uniref:Thiolase n=1 Tax=Sphingomonas panacis TaxID=1560345 RepID=A0A1B3ZEL7_9SPHN|nr:acetyl-CoA acetyltransferase [Sphingomonas panacis]AOH85886.1 thiolase [Sphingomonas panacis]
MTSERRAAAALIGAATFGIGEAPGFTSMDLAGRVALTALAQAGISLSEVDGLFIGLPNDFLSGLSFAEYLGIRPKLTNNNRTGGSAFLTHLNVAAHALAAGEIDVALIAYGSNQRTGAGGLVSAAAPNLYEKPYRPRLPVSAYALAASRHMHDYGTTRDHLYAVAKTARDWAMLNPEAFQRKPLSREDYEKARMVSDPLSVLDCCLVTDGAAAVVMVRGDRVDQRPAAYLLGVGEATDHYQIAQMPDLTTTAAKLSGARAYAQAGIGPADVDIVQLYDAFTINTILFLEDLGFCKKGEGGDFVASGTTGPGGKLPVNTNGGGLACVHPGMYGLFTVVEAYRQLTGSAGDRQIDGAEIAITHGNGGFLSSQVTAILGGAATQ